MLASGGSANGFEQMVRMEANHAVCRQAPVTGLGDLRRCPNQDVGIPNGRNPEFRVGADLDPYVSDIVFDGREARPFSQAEEGPFHRVALVADRYIREIRGKEIGLIISSWWEPFRHEVVCPC